MFQFIEDESGTTFKAVVKINHPAHGKSQFTGEFLLLEQDEFDEVSNQGDTAIVEKVLVGWKEDLKDADKQPMPFIEEVRAAMCKRAYLRTAIVQTYMAAFVGRRSGN